MNSAQTNIYPSLLTRLLLVLSAFIIAASAHANCTDLREELSLESETTAKAVETESFSFKAQMYGQVSDFDAVAVKTTFTGNQFNIYASRLFDIYGTRIAFSEEYYLKAGDGMFFPDQNIIVLHESVLMEANPFLTNGTLRHEVAHAVAEHLERLGIPDPFHFEIQAVSTFIRGAEPLGIYSRGFHGTEISNRINDLWFESRRKNIPGLKAKLEELATMLEVVVSEFSLLVSEPDEMRFRKSQVMVTSRADRSSAFVTLPKLGKSDEFLSKKVGDVLDYRVKIFTELKELTFQIRDDLEKNDPSITEIHSQIRELRKIMFARQRQHMELWYNNAPQNLPSP